ncbi:WD repeat-containing protein 13 [Holothuria leucospilota]|uniref:WD repeat-containing protein 13 n=1 Tax=Holothuria leucospilota TaxID=206669 RepID=A0A9Q1C2B1_HOLLE|nr:WD repeat-containing protein 13 [Holothuria leucospilota]
MASSWQQILAIDARYNAYRTPNSPQFRTLYVKRRSQLLRENAKAGFDSQIRKQYIRQRMQLLADKYGATITLSDQSSLRSRSTSIRGSTTNLSALEDPYGVRSQSRLSSNQLEVPGDGLLPKGLTPTKNAEASRALVGDNTIGENYAFAGMHHIFDQHSKAVTAVKFANDDKSRVACSSLDGTLSVCQVLPSPATVICILKGHSDGVTDFCWSLSNDLLLSSSLDGTVRLWVVSSGKCARIIEDPNKVPVHCCTFQPLNNNLVISGNSRGHVQVLNVSTGKTARGGLGKLPGRVLCLTCNDTGNLLWAGDDKSNLQSFIFDITSGKLSKGKRIVVSEGHPITCLSFRAWISREASDPSLLINCAYNSLCLYRIVSSDGEPRLRKTFSIKHRNENIRSSFCPLMSFREGACVVTGSEDMSVYFFDIERTTKPCVNKLQGHSAPVLAVSFNYDESLLASSDSDGLVIVWKRQQNAEENLKDIQGNI